MQQKVTTLGRRVIAGTVLASGIATAGLFATVAPASAGVGPANPELACNYDRIWGNNADKFNNTTPCQHFGPGWGYYVTPATPQVSPPIR